MYEIAPPVPFAIVICLGQKTYENTRKAIAADHTGKLDPFFPVPDHWHATQAAGFAALTEGVCFRFFKLYRQAIYGAEARMGLTAAHFKRKNGMNFNIMYRHLGVIKKGWLRVRSELLPEIARLATKDHDLLAFVTWCDYIVPVVYDLLQAVKRGSGAMYMKILPHFIVVLGLLDRSRYLSAFETYSRDLLRSKERLPDFLNGSWAI